MIARKTMYVVTLLLTAHLGAFAAAAQEANVFAGHHRAASKYHDSLGKDRFGGAKSRVSTRDHGGRQIGRHEGGSDGVVAGSGFPTRIRGLGTYAGSLQALRVGGLGNYFMLNGNLGASEPGSRPVARIIVVDQGNDCAWEQGVCVIRPRLD